jgi:hypothetical protein
MMRFGLTRTEAPADYDREASCPSINARRPTLQFKCIEVSEEMLPYEMAHRAVWQ